MIKFGINGKISYRIAENHNKVAVNYMMHIFNSPILIFLILFLFSASSQAAHGQHAPLTLVTEHRPPFQFLKDGEITGFSTQLIKAMLKHTPYQTKIFLYPWSRSYNLALKKENTCVFAIARTPERENNFKWTKKYFSTSNVFIGLKSSTDIEIYNLDDAKKYRIAVVRDDVTHQLLLEHGFIENKNMFIVNNPSSMLKLLQSRRLIDLVLTDEISLKYRVKYHDLDPTSFSSFYKLQEYALDFYLACSLNTEQVIVDDIMKGFEKIKQTGEYTKIMKQWLHEKNFRIAPNQP